IPLVEKWNALAKSIYVHEAGHVAVDKQDLGALNAQAQKLPSCDAVYRFWDDPHVYDKDDADQAAYHARLHADCRPEIGCIPDGWRGLRRPADHASNLAAPTYHRARRAGH